jgi:hypothetical protein
MTKNYVGKHRPSNTKLSLDDIRRMLEMKERIAGRRAAASSKAA